MYLPAQQTPGSYGEICCVYLAFAFASDGGGGGGAAAGTDEGFDVEYRWDRLPEEDEQAGVWLVFAASLVLTVFLAVDVCNSTSGGDSEWDEGRVGGRSPPPPPSSSSSLAPGGERGRRGEEGEGAGRAGSRGGALRPRGGGERRPRK